MAILGGERESQPAEVGAEAGAPDNVGRLDGAPAVQDGSPVVGPTTPVLGALHADAQQVGGLVADQRTAARPDLGADVPAHRRIVSTRLAMNDMIGQRTRPGGPRRPTAAPRCPVRRVPRPDGECQNQVRRPDISLRVVPQLGLSIMRSLDRSVPRAEPRLCTAPRGSRFN